MRPPHCGQTRLMMDEMMVAFDSPGKLSVMFIIASCSEIRQMCEGQIQATNNGDVPRGSDALGRSELVGCGVRLGQTNFLPPRSALQNASSMPIANSEQTP